MELSSKLYSDYVFDGSSYGIEALVAVAGIGVILGGFFGGRLVYVMVPGGIACAGAVASWMFKGSLYARYKYLEWRDQIVPQDSSNTYYQLPKGKKITVVPGGSTYIPNTNEYMVHVKENVLANHAQYYTNYVSERIEDNKL